ncbi:MAG: TetR/AcrR family transcriptional regulator [Spirochaetia bacterium]|nr:TetR/AcrR family transcriptional regulator [Spirochaetia bacterium]
MKLRSKTKDRILLEARNIILNEGISAFTLRKLGKALGIKASSIYEHYQNKKEILNALRNQCLEALYLKMKKVLAMKKTEKEQLLYLGESYIEFSMDEKELFQLFFSNFETNRKSIYETHDLNSPYKLLFDIFLKIQPKLRKERQEELALGYWSLIHGLAVLRNSFLSSFQVKWREPQKRMLLIYINGAINLENNPSRMRNDFKI